VLLGVKEKNKEEVRVYMPIFILTCLDCGNEFEHITPCKKGKKKLFCDYCLNRRENKYKRKLKKRKALLLAGNRA
jgi:hypothetical protein